MTANVIPLPANGAKPKAEPIKFTNTSLRKATADLADVTGVTIRDSELRGLILRKQKRDWIFGIERKIKSKIWRVSLEQYTGQNNIAAIRETVTGIYGEIANGTYRQVAKNEIGTGDKLQAMTFDQAVDLHLTNNPHLKAKTKTSYRFAAKKIGGSIRMAELDTAAVRNVYDRLIDLNKVATGNQMVRSVSAVWSTWAAEHAEGKEPTRNPTTALTKKRNRMVKVKPRTGAIPPEKQLAWFNEAKTGSDRLGATGGAYRALMILFLTGMRAQEVLGLTWDEVDGDSIHVDAARMKGSEDLIRPITPRLRAILDEQHRYNPDTEFVFPANRGNTGHLNDARKTLWVIGGAVFEDEKQITTHDLRRTFITAAMLAGVPDAAVKLLVGHTTRDITQAYALAIRSELPRLAVEIEDELMS